MRVFFTFEVIAILTNIIVFAKLTVISHIARVIATNIALIVIKNVVFLGLTDKASPGSIFCHDSFHRRRTVWGMSWLIVYGKLFKLLLHIDVDDWIHSQVRRRRILSDRLWRSWLRCFRIEARTIFEWKTISLVFFHSHAGWLWRDQSSRMTLLHQVRRFFNINLRKEYDRLSNIFLFLRFFGRIYWICINLILHTLYHPKYFWRWRFHHFQHGSLAYSLHGGPMGMIVGIWALIT